MSCLASAAFGGLLLLLVTVRCVQAMILQYRETGSLLTRFPDTEATRRWEHVNTVLYGSIFGVLFLVLAADATWLLLTSWPLLNDPVEWTIALSVIGGSAILGLCCGFSVWRSLRQRPWK
jgi:hypothetical protein